MSIPIKAKEKEKKKKDSRLSLWLLRGLWGVHPAGLLCSKFTFANICHAFFGGDVRYFCSLSKGFNSAPACTQANTPSQTQTHVTKPGEETYWAGSASVGSRVWHDSWVDSEEQRCSSLSYKIHRIFNLNHFAKSTRARAACTETNVQFLSSSDTMEWTQSSGAGSKDAGEHTAHWWLELAICCLWQERTPPQRLGLAGPGTFPFPVRSGGFWAAFYHPSQIVHPLSHQTNSFAGDRLNTAVDNSSNDF